MSILKIKNAIYFNQILKIVFQSKAVVLLLVNHCLMFHQLYVQILCLVLVLLYTEPSSKATCKGPGIFRTKCCMAFYVGNNSQLILNNLYHTENTLS